MHNNIENIRLHPVGRIEANDTGFALRLAPEYAPSLQGLEGFSHVQVVWWANGDANARGDADGKNGACTVATACDAARQALMVPAPYRTAPASLGVFATRLPVLPNPRGRAVRSTPRAP